MALKELCLTIGKAIKLPEKYHIAAVFQDNEHDDVIGWRVLDIDNNPITKILQVKELDNWRNHIICK